MIDLEQLYKEETNKEASYEREDPFNCNRTNIVNTLDYICWLEDKLIGFMGESNTEDDFEENNTGGG